MKLEEWQTPVLEIFNFEITESGVDLGLEADNNATMFS